MIDVKIKRLSETATLPTYGSKKAAAMDLYANCPLTLQTFEKIYDYTIYNGQIDWNIKGLTIQPHETVKIGTGFAIQPPEGYCALILARSGLATKQGLAPANKVGLCDEDYTGEYIVSLHNHSDIPQVVYRGDRIAQLMFVPYEQANLIEVSELEETERGSGGFGSTGK